MIIKDKAYGSFCTERKTLKPALFAFCASGGPRCPKTSVVCASRKIFILAEKMVECEDEKELCYALILRWMAMAAMDMAELWQLPWDSTSSGTVFVNVHFFYNISFTIQLKSS